MGEANRGYNQVSQETYMRKIFITVNDGSIARNILRSFVLAGILARPDIAIGLITHESKVRSYEREFGGERVRIFGVPQRRLTFYERILSYLIRNGLRTKTILMDQRTHIDGRYMAFIVKRAITYFLGGSRLFHSFIRLLFLFRSPSPFARELFLKEKPDLLFSTDVQTELDFDAIAAAHKTGVKIVGMVRSWDNPTSRGGLIPYIPKMLLVWSPYLRRISVRFQDVPAERMTMVGIPHYDWYTRKDIIMSRGEFLRHFGIDPVRDLMPQASADATGRLVSNGVDPSKKIILFAGEGAFHAPHEVEVLGIISEALKAGKIENSGKVAVVFRPHPAFKVDRESVKKLDNIIFDEDVSGYTGKDPSSWEMGKAEIAHLVNSLYHADLIVTIASTMAIDAIAFDKPVICVAFDGKSEEPQEKSVRRYYSDYTHYVELAKTRGFKIAFDSEKLVQYINEYLQNSSLDREGREKIKEDFIWKLDGLSAERIANALIGYLDDKLWR